MVQRVPRRIGIIFNPRKNRDALGDVLESFRAAGIETTVLETEDFEDIGVKTRSLIDRGVSAVLSGGGDGTLLGVFDSLVHTDIPIGVLPLGCSNDYAKALGIGSLEEAVESVLADRTREVDVGLATYRTSDQNPAKMYFCSSAGVGLIADVFRVEEHPVVVRLKKVAGDLVWPFLTFYRSFRSRPTKSKLTMNGDRVMEVALRLLEVSKTKTNGGFKFTPDSEVDNGLLDFWMMKGVSFARVVQTILWIGVTNRPQRLSSISYFTSKPHPDLPQGETIQKIDVDTMDPLSVHLNGDFVGQTPATFEIVKDIKVRMFCAE